MGRWWVSELGDFHFTIRYWPWRLNIDADALSRLATDPEKVMSACTEELSSDSIEATLQMVEAQSESSMPWSVAVACQSPPTCAESSGSSAESMPKHEIRRAQKEDKDIESVSRYLLSGVKPLPQQWRTMSPAAKCLMREWDCSTSLIWERFFWPRMQCDIDHYVLRTWSCIKQKKPCRETSAPLKPIITTYPFEFVSVDFLQLEKCKGGYEYIQVIVDHFTRFAQTYATTSKSSKTVADKLPPPPSRKWPGGMV